MNISAVVIAKNEEKYIERCLKHLKDQTLKSEIIVVDGHSTDRTVSIARKYANRVVYDSGKGVSDARNIGWKTAKGDVVAYCDADCLPPRDWLENISKLMDDRICVSGPLYPYDGDSLMKIQYKIWTVVIARFFGFLGLKYVWGSNMAIRKDILRKYPFRTKILEDYDMAKRIRKVGKLGYFKKLIMPVSSRNLRHGFLLSVVKFYARNYFRIKFGLDERVGTYWKD